MLFSLHVHINRNIYLLLFLNTDLIITHDFFWSSLLICNKCICSLEINLKRKNYIFCTRVGIISVFIDWWWFSRLIRMLRPIMGWQLIIEYIRYYRSVNPCWSSRLWHSSWVPVITCSTLKAFDCRGGPSWVNLW